MPPKRKKKKSGSSEWVRLQRKIFSRWVNMKVSRSGMTCKDIVEDIKTGVLMIRLLEALSEKKFGKMPKKPPTMSIQQISLMGDALKFCWGCGVQMSVKPSAESIVGGEQKPIMALIWAIMLRFIKIGDDEEGGESLNAKEALLLWVKNKVSSYGLEPNGFGKDFHDGMVMNALIHKHRPGLVDWDSLNASNKLQNLEAAQNAALEYFDLEKYITPAEITKLDENSMVVYISEFYYGIAEQRKVDLAARRMTKLVKLTKENDAMKEEFNNTGIQLKERMKKVEAVLAQIEIDNTMEGARNKIAEFYDYKTTDKNMILKDQLSLEGLFNNLAMRLAHHKRPDYVPPEGCSLKEIEDAIAHMESCEQERNVALHAELNRQIKLVQLDGQHMMIQKKLQEWYEQKKAYLEKKEEIDSVSGAQLHLRLLDAFDKESVAVKASTVGDLIKLGDELESEKYENMEAIRAREAEVEEHFVELGELSAKKRPVLDDDLSREQFKSKIRLNDEQHQDYHQKLLDWIAKSKEYLELREEVTSVPEARTQLSLLEAFEKEKALMLESKIVQLNQLGEDINNAKYETEYSSWVFETPEAVVARQDEIAAIFSNDLTELSAEKKRVLDDHLAREEFRERLRIDNETHLNKNEQIIAWCEKKQEYLKTKEVVESVSEAQRQLSLLSQYEKEKVSMEESRIVEFKKLADHITTAKYETDLSSYVFDDPGAVTDRVAAVDEQFGQLLPELSAEKKRVLDDHLARELFKADVELQALSHEGMKSQLDLWIDQKTEYLVFKEEISSVNDAKTHLTLFDAYEKEHADMANTSFAELKKLGEDIKAQKYETEYSTYVFDRPEELDGREEEVRKQLEEVLPEHAKAKKALLDDHLAREEEKDRIRLLNNQHVSQYDKLEEWIATKDAGLNERPSINSLSDAERQLALLEGFRKEKESTISSTVSALKKTGESILTAKYESEFSSYSFENPAEVTDREKAIDDKMAGLLVDAEAGLKTYLDEQHAIEVDKENMRLEFAHKFAEYVRFVKDTGDKAELTTFGFTLEEVQEFSAKLAELDETAKSEANALGDDIKKFDDEMKAKEITENIYTEHSVDDIPDHLQKLDDMLALRKGRYDEELARQVANDELCKEFAGAVEPFSKWISEKKEQITESKEELENQLEFVNSCIATEGEDAKPLATISEINDRMTEAGITNIRHTNLTLKDVEVQWEQYQKFLEAKKGMLEQEIENLKLRGITPEQFAEIEQNFKLFDKDESGTIDRKELTACLYSLGEERVGSEIKEIMSTYGKNNVMDYEAFKEYMIKMLGDSDTRDEVLEGIKLINKYAAMSDIPRMEQVVPADDMTYFKETCPKTGDDLDYNKWIEELFAR